LIKIASTTLNGQRTARRPDQKRTWPSVLSRFASVSLISMARNTRGVAQ
jgi:hypothetical protein